MYQTSPSSDSAAGPGTVTKVDLLSRITNSLTSALFASLWFLNLCAPRVSVVPHLFSILRKVPCPVRATILDEIV
jgi:hypothetical protein